MVRCSHASRTSSDDKRQLGMTTNSGPHVRAAVLRIRNNLIGQHRKRRADIVWPDNDGQQPLTEAQLQKTDGKKPSRYPEQPDRTMLLNLYIVHVV